MSSRSSGRSFLAMASALIATSTFLYRFSLPTYTKVGSAVRPAAGSGWYRTQSTPGWMTRMWCASTPRATRSSRVLSLIA